MRQTPQHGMFQVTERVNVLLLLRAKASSPALTISDSSSVVVIGPRDGDDMSQFPYYPGDVAQLLSLSLFPAIVMELI